MKKLLGINLLIALAIVFASCGTNNNVVSNGLISKRKFNKGFHINKKGNMKSSKDAKQEESIAFDDSKKSSTKTEVAPVRASKKTEKKSEVIEETRVENEEVAYTETKPEYVENRSGTDALEADDATSVQDSYEADAIDDQEEKSNKSNKSSKKRKEDKGSNGAEDVMFILIVIVTILIPPLGVAIYTNIDWMKVLICLILTLLFYLPGLIYGLLVVFDVI